MRRKSSAPNNNNDRQCLLNIPSSPHWKAFHFTDGTCRLGAERTRMGIHAIQEPSLCFRPPRFAAASLQSRRGLEAGEVSKQARFQAPFYRSTQTSHHHNVTQPNDPTWVRPFFGFHDQNSSPDGKPTTF